MSVETSTPDTTAHDARTPDAPGTDAPELGSRDDLGDQVMRLVRLVDRAATHLKVRGDGVDRATYLLLVHLVRQGPRRLTALAGAVHSDPSTVSRQVAALVRSGLVERRPDPADGRASLLAATPAGELVHAENRRVRDAFLAEVVAGWPGEDRAALLDLLVRFNDGIVRVRPRLPALAAAARAAAPDRPGPPAPPGGDPR